MNGRFPLLALDLGEKRIGVALCDSLGIAAQPLEVFGRTSRQADFEHVGRLVAQHGVQGLLIGLPISLDGHESAFASWVRDYGTALGTAVHLPITFWDESLTSVQAEQMMREAGYKRHQMTGKLDAIAAALILQSYLERLREG